MAFSTDNFASERNNAGLIHLRWRLTFGASGVVSKAEGFGFDDATPPVQTGTGAYTITLPKQSFGVVSWRTGWAKRASGAACLGADMTADNTSNSSRNITFETKIAAGTVTNPASGDVLTISAVVDEMGAYR